MVVLQRLQVNVLTPGVDSVAGVVITPSFQSCPKALMVSVSLCPHPEHVLVLVPSSVHVADLVVFQSLQAWTCGLEVLSSIEDDSLTLDVLSGRLIELSSLFSLVIVLG